jgi:hypothetical protein
LILTETARALGEVFIFSRTSIVEAVPSGVQLDVLVPGERAEYSTAATASSYQDLIQVHAQHQDRINDKIG